MKLRFMTTMALFSLAAWPAGAQPTQPAPPSALETLGAMHQRARPLIGPKSRRLARRPIRSSRI